MNEKIEREKRTDREPKKILTGTKHLKEKKM